MDQYLDYDDEPVQIGQWDYQAGEYYSVYGTPERFKLTTLATLNRAHAGDWGFDYVVIWRHEDGTVLWGEDSGCSCPAPFENVRSYNDLNVLNEHTWPEFERAVRKNTEDDTNHATPKQINDSLDAARAALARRG